VLWLKQLSLSDPLLTPTPSLRGGELVSAAKSKRRHQPVHPRPFHGRGSGVGCSGVPQCHK
jgi:hypothetical protein